MFKSGVLFAPRVIQLLFAPQVSSRVEQNTETLAGLFSGVKSYDLLPLSTSGSIKSGQLQMASVRMRNDSGKRISALIIRWDIVAGNGNVLTVTSTWDSFGYQQLFRGASGEFEVDAPSVSITSQTTIHQISATPMWVEYEVRESKGEMQPAVVNLQDRRQEYFSLLEKIKTSTEGKSRHEREVAFTDLAESATPTQKPFIALHRKQIEEDPTYLNKLLTDSVVRNQKNQ